MSLDEPTYACTKAVTTAFGYRNMAYIFVFFSAKAGSCRAGLGMVSSMHTCVQMCVTRKASLGDSHGSGAHT